MTRNGESLLFDLDKSKAFKLNSVSLRIWTLLDGTRSADEVAKTLSSEYEVEESVAISDVVSFVQKTRALGIVV